MIAVRTLYIRNVPDEVAARLESLAAAKGVSLNTLAVRELTDAARRSFNAAILADLPELGLDLDEVAEIIREGRDRR